MTVGPRSFAAVVALTVAAFLLRLAVVWTEHPLGTDGYYYVVQIEDWAALGRLHVPDSSWVLRVLALPHLLGLDPVASLAVAACGLAALVTPAAWALGAQRSETHAWLLAILAAGSPTLTHLTADFPKNLGAVAPLVGLLAALVAARRGSRRAWGVAVVLALLAATAHRLGAVFVGLIIALVQGGLVRRLAPKLGERLVTRIGLLLTVPGFLLIGRAEDAGLLYTGLAFMAFGSALVMPCLSALISRYTPEDRQGLALGTFRSMGSLSRAFGPVLGAAGYWYFGSEAPYQAGAVLLVVIILKGVRIVPQAEKYVVERFGRLHAVLGPGINFVVPFLDVVKHRISILERQLPTASQDAITKDNVLVQVETSVFYRILEPEKTVYRIRDVDAAIATTVAGIVRAEIGKMDLDEVQSNRANLISSIQTSVEDAVDNWGIEVTRAEILDVNLDQATREAMLQQLNAERARRAQVTEAEGSKRAVELAADAELYAAEQKAKARRIQAEAEAYATQVVARAIAEHGIEAAQYQVALKQVEALNALGNGEGKRTIVLPANAIEAFGDAFSMLRGAR